MSYLLDTNACIALINGKPGGVRSRFQIALDAHRDIFVSVVVAFELWYGVEKSVQKEANARRVHAFFSGPVAKLPFEEEDARWAAAVRAAAESSGMPIGAYDLLIAGQALRHNLTLVTANAREFRRVKSLSWEDWAK